MKSISFPKDEIKEIRTLLDEKRNIFTIRTDKEFNKYKKGDLLKSNCGYMLKVVNIIKAKNFGELKKKYKYFDKAMKKHTNKINEIKKFKEFDIIELKKIK